MLEFTNETLVTTVPKPTPVPLTVCPTATILLVVFRVMVLEPLVVLPTTFGCEKVTALVPGLAGVDELVPKVAATVKLEVVKVADVTVA